MPLFHIVILALVQGLTEFLPVSSSGHLVITHAILGDASKAENITLDIAVHVGTLLAVLFYFRSDVIKMIKGLLTLPKSHYSENEGAKLSLYVIIGSLPVIIGGFLMHQFQPTWVRSLELTAFCTVFFGVILWAADRRASNRSLEQMTIKNALIIGLMQVLALIPGTSRSGITMTAARFLGFNRPDAARYSLLLAIVAISGAGALTGLALLEDGDKLLGLSVLYAVFLSAVSGWAAIALMMRWLEKASFAVFALYRVVGGVLLYVLIYNGFLG